MLRSFVMLYGAVATLGLALVGFASGLSFAQDSEQVVSAPVQETVRAFGEQTYFVPDGGCMCQPVGTRFAVAPYACNGTCAVSRARVRNAVADAIDGGVLQ